MSRSVAEHYPHFEERVRAALVAVLGKEVEQRIKIGMAKDGSGVGGQLLRIPALDSDLTDVCFPSRSLCTSGREGQNSSQGLGAHQAYQITLRL